MVRKIATAGRATTSECVTEYIVQYSDDGELWKSVTDSSGEEQVKCKCVQLKKDEKPCFCVCVCVSLVPGVTTEKTPTNQFPYACVCMVYPADNRLVSCLPGAQNARK